MWSMFKNYWPQNDVKQFYVKLLVVANMFLFFNITCHTNTEAFVCAKLKILPRKERTVRIRLCNVKALN